MTRPTTFKDPSGEIRSIKDLTDLRTTKRWVISRKAWVVCAIKAGVITKEDALHWYNIYTYELDAWIKKYEADGEKALRTTKIKDYQ